MHRRTPSGSDGEDIVLVYSCSGANTLTNRYLVGPNIDEILAGGNTAGVVTLENQVVAATTSARIR